MKPSPLTLVTFFQFQPGGRDKLREFQDRAAPLFLRHGLSINVEFEPRARGQLGTTPNTLESPDLIQVATLESLAQFQAYLADPQLPGLASIRAQGLKAMTASFGPSCDLGGGEQEGGDSALHFLALTTFTAPGGLDDLGEFNRRGLASGLFSRYGIRVGRVAGAEKTLVVVGDPAFSPPQGLVHFSVEDPALLKSYLGDPELQALAPLRDRSLATYFFFQGVATR